MESSHSTHGTQLLALEVSKESHLPIQLHFCIFGIPQIAPSLSQFYYLVCPSSASHCHRATTLLTSLHLQFQQ